MNSLLHIGLFFSGFACLDTLLTRCGLEGVYYAVHAIHNACIVYFAKSDVWNTITNFSAIDTKPNYITLELCFALHFYHIAYYWRKFRMDDWLHHILMIGIALPIGGCVPSGTLLGYSLFFTTGLPGGIDYTLLFLTRNNWLNKDTEKKINTYLHVWIRSPGCVSLATYTLAHASINHYSNMTQFGIYVVALLNYWNGQYFMEQVVLDAGKRMLRI